MKPEFEIRIWRNADDHPKFPGILSIQLLQRDESGESVRVESAAGMFWSSDQVSGILSWTKAILELTGCLSHACKMSEEVGD